MTVPFLRVLIEERSDKPDVVVAICLETGNVATANSYQKAREMIIQILQDEFRHARQYSNFQNFFRSPANAEIVRRWDEAIREFGSEEIEVPFFSQREAPVEFSKLPEVRAA